MKVVKLSALHTGRLCPPGNIRSNHFCYRLSRSDSHSEAGRIITLSGIEPATFRLIAQCLNQPLNRVPRVPDQGREGQKNVGDSNDNIIQMYPFIHAYNSPNAYSTDNTRNNGR